MNNKKLKNLILKGTMTEKIEANLSKNASKMLKNKFILNALKKDNIKMADILNASDLTIEALNYPSIKKCLLKKINKFYIFYNKFCVKQIFKIKTKEELADLVKEAQKMIRRSPFSIFQVPSNLHDEIHELKQQLLCF